MLKENLYERVMESLPASAQHLRAWLSFVQCFNSIERILLSHFAQKFNSGISRYDVLTALTLYPDGLTMGELARLLMVTKGNVTGVIRRLTQEKLVTKKVSKTDQRVQVVKLSRKGVRLWEEMRADYDHIISVLLSSQSPKEVASLVSKLEKTRAAVEDKSAECGYE